MYILKPEEMQQSLRSSDVYNILQNKPVVPISYVKVIRKLQCNVRYIFDIEVD